MRRTTFLLVAALTAGCANDLRLRGPDRSRRADEAALERSKHALGELTDRYLSLADRGGLTGEVCDELAAGLHDLYVRHGEPMAVAEFNRGVVLEDCGRPDAAAKVYAELIDAVPGYQPAYNNLGLIYWGRGEHERGAQVLRRGLELDPLARHLQNNVGVARLRLYTTRRSLGDFDAAARHMRRALLLDTDTPIAYENLARLYYERARGGEPSFLLLADLVVEQGILMLGKTKQESARLYNVRGLVRLEQGRDIEALQWFRRAVRVDHGLTDAHVNGALIALRFRGFDRATESLGVAVESPEYRENPDVWLALGVARRGAAAYDAAEEAYRTAADLDATDPRPWFNLGLLYQEHIATGDDLSEAGLRKANKTARKHLQKFIGKAGTRTEYAELVEDAKRRMRQIDELEAALDHAAKLAEELRKMEQQEQRDAERDRQRLRDLERRAREQAEAAEAPAS